MSTVEHTLTINPHAIENLQSKLFGSRRILSYEQSINSDYDIYIHISELEKLGTSYFELKAKNLLKDTTNYITSLPKYGKVYLITKILTTCKTTADLLIFTDKRDIYIMDKVLQTLEKSSLSYRLLQSKKLRINVYNYLLQSYGFKAKPKTDKNTINIKTKLIAKLITSLCNI